MYKVLDIEQWNRQSAYHFFKDYEDPYFNITGNIEVTQLLRFCKERKASFFLNTLYAALHCVNNIPAFKYRILDGKVIEFEQIFAGSTVLNPDNSFSFCYFDYEKDSAAFELEGKKRIAKINEKGGIDERTDSINLIHCSTIPWIKFTSFKNARKRIAYDTIPKIVFGQYFPEGEKVMLPLSVEVHHAMMDGYHVGMLFKKMEAYCNLFPNFT